MRLLLAALMAFDAVLGALLTQGARGVTVVAAAVAVISAWLFARKGPVWGWTCLISAAIVIQPLQQRFLFFSGTALLGWLCGFALTRDEHQAEHGAVGALAAAYFGSLLSKLLDAGGAWGLQAALAGQHVWGRPTDGLVALILSHPPLASALGIFTLAAEGSAIFMPFSRRGRALSGALLLTFHAGVWLLTPIFFPQAMILLAALSFRRIPDATVPTPRLLKGAAAAAAVVAAAWLAPGHDFPPGKPPSAAARARLGSVVEGSEVAGLTVRHIEEPAPGIIRVQLGTLRVELVPHGARQAKPARTLGDLDLYYRGAEVSEAILDALAERLRR
jgi:hypothetical protein